MAIAKTELARFLCDVDDLFPVPLSEKVDIGEYAEKLLSYATLVPEFREGRLRVLWRAIRTIFLRKVLPT